MAAEAEADFSKLYEQGLEAGRRRDYRRAAELFARVAGGSDRHPQALLYLGRSWHALGELDRAVGALAAYRRRRPQSAAGRLFLGRALLARGDSLGGARELAAAAKLRPEVASTHGLLGVALLRSHRFEGALSAFSEAMRLEPDNKRLETAWLNATLVLAVRWFYRGRLVDAARLFSSVLDRRGATIVAHVYLGRIYRDLGRDAMALIHIERACLLSPEDAALRFQRAAVLLTLGRPAEATEEVKAGAALAGVPSAPSGQTPEGVQRLLAVSLFAQRRYREAAAQAVRVLRTEGHDSRMHALAGEAYHALGELEKARNHFQRALEHDREASEPRYGLLAVLRELGAWQDLDAESRRLLHKTPTDATASYFHGLALARLAPTDPQTLTALQEQIRSRGPDPALMLALADSYQKAGLPDLAEGWYRRTLKVSPRDEGALRSLAALLEPDRKGAELADIYRRVLEVRPEDRLTRRRLLNSLLERQAWDEAIPELERLLAAEAGSRKWRATLSHCYRRAGRYADALVVLRDLITERPGDEEHVKAAVFCLEGLGLRRNAIALAERFQRDHGDRLDLALASGVLSYRDGKLEQAAAAFRRAAGVAPKEWRAWRNLGMVYRRMGVQEFADKFLATAERCRRQSDDRATGG
jgi:tetratricopeptide (TPR) repeat protein